MKMMKKVEKAENKIKSNIKEVEEKIKDLKKLKLKDILN